jgi:AcrR family transcriptional regulator
MRLRDPQLNAARRAAILEAAANCFVRQGFHATSMKDVCAEAKMSPGTLYHYFRSKADIIAGIIEDERRMADELVRPLAAAPDFAAALFEAVDVLAGSVTDRDLVLHAEISAELLRQPQLRERAAAADRQSRDTLAAAIAEAQRASSVDRRLNADHTAAILFALIDGHLWNATLHGAAALAPRLPALKQAIARILADPE